MPNLRAAILSFTVKESCEIVRLLERLSPQPLIDSRSLAMKVVALYGEEIALSISHVSGESSKSEWFQIRDSL